MLLSNTRWVGCVLFVTCALVSGRWYSGSQCYSNSSTIKPCPYSAACTKIGKEYCTLIATGKYRRNSKVSCILPNQNRDNICDDTSEKDGYLERGIWRPVYGADLAHKRCKYIWFCPNDVLKDLNGYVFLFFGDSLIRQLFLRFVFYHRGLNEIVERYHHKDAHYSVNVSDDSYAVYYDRIEGRSLQKLKFTDGSSALDLMFIWSPGLDNYRLNQATKDILNLPNMKNRPVVFVMGLNFWVDDGHCFRESSSYGAFHDKYVKGTVNRLFWVPMPNAVNRNAFFRRWDQWSDTYVLPLDKILDLNVFTLNEEDNKHFQCSYTRDQPDALVPIEVEYVKTPRSGDCRDMANLNVLQIMMSTVVKNVGKVYK